MSVVYRAKDLRQGRVVALKLFAPALTQNEGFRRRLAHDSRTATAIDHPHIVPIFEVDETDGVLYLAMQYVPGLDLRALLDREGSLPVPTALRIAAQVASGLDAAHEHDLVHRGVEPSNILVAAGTDSDHSEHVYLTNFGISETSLALSGFTTAGTIVGTLDYMAPEQISARSVDGRSDQYSLACVVYEALAGRPPFEGNSALELGWVHQYDPPPALSQARPEIARAADAVMAKALAKAPEDRYSSCQEFVAHLRTAASSGVGAPSRMRAAERPEVPTASPPSPPAPGDAAGSTPPGPPFGDDDDEW
ncbi:serine/threonine-protein kinase [Streptomyces sp. NPDC004266]|uniref:serine/threonine-protein kinase n=1 Tax=Streptomyces sp. NPDC004266 TaxID=3364693 RepID=UPI00368B071F